MVKKSMLATKDLKGFTLIELMVAIAVLGILLAIAIPNYNEYVVKARRTEAQSDILQIRLGLEKWRANNASYRGDATAGSLGTSTSNALANVGFTDSNNYYNYAITIPAVDNTSLTDDYSFSISATAQGTQATKDSACSPLTFNQDGTKGPAGCWKK